jgi:hypothetical protein
MAGNAPCEDPSGDAPPSLPISHSAARGLGVFREALSGQANGHRYDSVPYGRLGDDALASRPSKSWPPQSDLPYDLLTASRLCGLAPRDPDVF